MFKYAFFFEINLCRALEFGEITYTTSNMEMSYKQFLPRSIVKKKCFMKKTKQKQNILIPG